MKSFNHYLQKKASQDNINLIVLLMEKLGTTHHETEEFLIWWSTYKAVITFKRIFFLL